MVKLPKEVKKYCPFCGKHTMHTLKEAKKGKVNPLREKHRKRQRRIEKGYGSFPYEDPSHRTRGKKNPASKKKDLKLICKECGKAHKPRKAVRAAKFEIVS